MKKRQATKKYMKKRQTTKKYKKHTKKHRKTRNIIRRHRNTRKLNKKKQRGGLTDIEVASTIKKNIEEKNQDFKEFIQINGGTENDIITSLSEMLSAMPLPITELNRDTPEIIKKYCESAHTKETELAKIQRAYTEYFNEYNLTDEQFIYLILTTNELDITPYSKDIIVCKDNKNKIVQALKINKNNKNKNDNNIVNSLIFSCFFKINMLIMKHFLNPDDFEMPTAKLFLTAYGNPLTLTSFIEPFVSNSTGTETEFRGFENLLEEEEERKKKKAEEEAFENDFGGFDEKFD